MNHNTNTVTRSHLSTYKLKGRGKVIITQDLADQIAILHAAHPGKEWSGVLVIEPINEDIAVPDNVILRALAVYPMDFGTPGYTEYTVNEEILKIYEIFPEADPANYSEDEKPKLKFAQIHTHHHMSTFFSGTDEAELRDNAGKYDYYLSLIVNVSGPYMAKVAFHAEVPQVISVKGKNGVKTIERPSLEILAYFDVDVVNESERDVPEWFTEKVEELKKNPSTHYTFSEHATSYNSRNSSPYSARDYSPAVSTQNDTHADFWGYDKRKAETAKKEKEKKKESATGVVSLKDIGIEGSRIRTYLPFLFLDNPREAHVSTLLSIIDGHPLKEGSADEIKNYTMRVLNRLDTWMDDHFAEELTAYGTFAKDLIVTDLKERVELFDYSDNPVATSLVTGFKAYLEVLKETT